MGAVSILAEALAGGGRVQLEPPRLWLPKGVREQLEPERETIREVLRRAAIFREQATRFLREGRALPTLALPEHQGVEGCWSCGSPLHGRRYRCEVCTLAVALALEGM